MLEKEEFLKKYNLTEQSLEKYNIEWTVLGEIYEDYKKYTKELEKHAEFVANMLRDHDKVHSVRARVKDPEHLMAKLIRKTPIRRKSRDDPNFQFSLDNYRDEITDLVGVRAIHIFKEEWQGIHNYITNKWKTIEEEAKIRRGDDSKMYEEAGVEVKDYESGYRSVHYIIESYPTNHKILAEIQVRTIFEEGFGEIDHQLHYPQKNVPEIIVLNLLLLNRLAGSADEMTSFISSLKSSWEDREKAIYDKKQEIKELKDTIEDLKNQIEESDMNSQAKKSVVSGLDSIRSYNFNYDDVLEGKIRLNNDYINVDSFLGSKEKLIEDYTSMINPQIKESTVKLEDAERTFYTDDDYTDN